MSESNQDRIARTLGNLRGKALWTGLGFAIVAFVACIPLGEHRFVAGSLAAAGILVLTVVTALVFDRLGRPGANVVTWVAVSYFAKLVVVGATVLLARQLEAYPIYVAVWVLIFVLTIAGTEVLFLTRTKVLPVD